MKKLLSFLLSLMIFGSLIGQPSSPDIEGNSRLSILYSSVELVQEPVSVFKKNRKTINLTALGLFGAGFAIGLINTLSCNKTATGDHRCVAGVVVGSVLGFTGAALTLLIAHPINRIKNKKNDLSFYLNQYPRNTDVALSIGFIGNGIGLAVKF